MPAPTTPAPVTGVMKNVTIKVKFRNCISPSLTGESYVLIPSCVSVADAQAQALTLVPTAIAAGTILRYPINCVPM
jgi:hypothetical protein